jgi:ABC-type spermidine/putrescine transport system permease subunit II
VDDYHVTVLYIGKDEEKLEKQIYKEFEEGVSISVQILALVIVPGKIITAICFPDHTTENKIPHVTLMTNNCAPAFSNQVLQSSC